MKRLTHRHAGRLLAALAATFILGATSPARAEPAPEPAPFKVSGYAEAFYQWNLGAPSNGITNARGFDNRHNAFTLSNVVLGAQWDAKNVIGELTLQVGHTPSTYYLAEPNLAGTNAANASGSELWKYVQQAFAGYRFGVGRGLTVTAGLQLVPGPEAMAVRDNWNWSRSNLFFALPFYHSGARAAYPLSKAWTLTLGVWNGWNSVVDNNAEKSVSAQFDYARGSVTAAVMYFGGVERASNAPEGRAFRHLFDGYVNWSPTRRFSMLAHANGGAEPNRFGVSRWGAGALYARLVVTPTLSLAVRGDALYERRAESGQGRAAPIFFAVPWVSSRTATIDFHPQPLVSFRLEYRRDDAGGNLYFGGDVTGDGVTSPYITNRRTQDTMTLGVTGGF